MDLVEVKARLFRAQKARIDALVGDKNNQTSIFIREAVERELARREAEPKKAKAND